MRSVDVLVIGAGPSGLSLAYGLQGDTLVLEKEDEVGGLCRSIEHDGGVFDIGGHSFHTPHPEVRELVEDLMGENWETQPRDARVYSHGALIPYPFQKNFEEIPDPEVVRECRQGLDERGGASEAGNFQEFIVRRFGPGIAKHFMLPYNRKIWARDIREISCEWTKERVAAPKGEKEKFDTKGGERKPLQSDTMVGYPAEGGYQEIYRAFAERVPAVETGQEVISIDPGSRTATTARGTRVRWNRLVSTMPLDRLLGVVDGVPDTLRRRVSELQYMSLNLLLLLVGRRLPDAPHRVYVADHDVPPHKIAFNHTSSSNLRNRPVHAIMAEISYSEEKPLGEPGEVERRTVEFLEELDLLAGPDDVVWSDHLDVKYAYPVYTPDRPAIVEAAKEWLGEQGMFTLGRFGEWEYINSDKCIKKGLELAATLERASAASRRVGEAAG